MMNKRIYWLLLVGMIVAQLTVPIVMIWQREYALHAGDAFHFECAPVDPNDPFRGKYITLSYKENHVVVDTSSAWANGDKIYLGLGVQPNGMVIFDKIGKSSSEVGSPYLKTRVEYVMPEGLDQQKAFVDLPFNRYYLEESKATPAEDLYRTHVQDSVDHQTYAVVRIHQGRAVLQDVQINGQSITSFLNR